MKKAIIILSTSSIALLPLSLPLVGCGSQLKQVHILNICDTHGEIPGYGDDFFDEQPYYPGAIRTSQSIQKIVKQYPGSVVLSGGDNNSSGTFSTCTQGDTMYPVLRSMDIRYSAVGNHAWEWGLDKLTQFHYDQLGRTEHTDGNYFVTSNVLNHKEFRDWDWHYHEGEAGFQEDYEKWKTNKVEWADPYKIIDLNHHLVCLIGLTTTVTMEDGNKEAIKDTSFIPYIPAVWYTKHFIKEQEGQAVFDAIDAFVLFTHIGAGQSEGTGLAENIDTNIDLILGAHTHTDYAEYFHNDILNKDIPFVESQAHMSSFSDAIFYFNDSKPLGQRLDHIEVQTITPEVDCGGHDPKSDDPEERQKAKAAAAAQIEYISQHPETKVVSETVAEYNKQKQIAKEQLNQDLCQSNDGLSYTQLGHQFDQPYFYCETIIEQAGAFLCKSEIEGFDILLAQEIAQGNMKKACVAYCTNDSINIDLDAGPFKLKDVYGFFPYDNQAVYCCLTYYQMEQIIEYILAGADRDNLQESYYYTKDLFYEPGQKADIQELRFPYGPNQLYGVSFKVKQVAPTEENYGSVYQYQPESLKVYDPEKSGANIDDPSTYGDKQYWQSNNRLVRMILSNFNFDEGNKQQKMIKAFAEFNEVGGDEWTKVHRITSMDLRELMKSYLAQLQSSSKTADLSLDILRSMFIIEA